MKYIICSMKKAMNLAVRLAFALIFLAISLPSFAEIKIPIKPNPPRLVNDFAGILSPSYIAQMEHSLRLYADSTSNEIAIITIKGLDDYPAIEYAYTIGDAWGIGRKGKDNGVVILIAPNDRKLAIAPGRGLTGALPDITCKQIIRRDFSPQFKAGNYEAGISQGVSSIINSIQGEFSADPSSAEGDPLVTLLIMFFIFFLLFFLMYRMAKRNKSFTTVNQRGWRDQYPSSRGDGGIWWFPTGGGDFDNNRGGGGGGGSSWGGFGGGGFDGGGASGGW
ncbi:MAG: TPM domain-containing protein [Saprospiraceae bacterium]|jgi:uncharacterized protein|nr:TPM domain-containing protein [Saprospiraceae bacterium]MBL0294680.1 TPM domain-containing protein [Saprospiraceae bacterium]